MIFKSYLIKFLVSNVNMQNVHCQLYICCTLFSIPLEKRLENERYGRWAFWNYYGHVWEGDLRIWVFRFRTGPSVSISFAATSLFILCTRHHRVARVVSGNDHIIIHWISFWFADCHAMNGTVPYRTDRAAASYLLICWAFLSINFFILGSGVKIYN